MAPDQSAASGDDDSHRSLPLIGWAHPQPADRPRRDDRHMTRVGLWHCGRPLCYYSVASNTPRTRYSQGASFDGRKPMTAGTELVAARGSSGRAEAIRLELADAWGQMGAAWGVAP